MSPATPREYNRWLERQLRAMYDAAAAEPLPADLERLVEQLRSRKPDARDRARRPDSPAADRPAL